MIEDSRLASSGILLEITPLNKNELGITAVAAPPALREEDDGGTTGGARRRGRAATGPGVAIDIWPGSTQIDLQLMPREV